MSNADTAAEVWGMSRHSSSRPHSNETPQQGHCCPSVGTSWVKGNTTMAIFSMVAHRHNGFRKYLLLTNSSGYLRIFGGTVKQNKRNPWGSPNHANFPPYSAKLSLFRRKGSLLLRTMRAQSSNTYYNILFRWNISCTVLEPWIH